MMEGMERYLALYLRVTALALFLAQDAQALDQRCATLRPEQLVACLNACPNADGGVACRKSCVDQHNKLKSDCKLLTPIFVPGPLLDRSV